MRSVSPRALEIMCHFAASTGIFRRAAAVGEDARQPILRDRVAAQRGLAKQRRGRLFVLGDAVAIEECDGVFDLRIGVVGDRSQRPKPHRFLHVLGDAAALLVERAQRVLRFRIAGRRGDAEQFGGADEILREQLALDIE